jgi:hypothetical protein
VSAGRERHLTASWALAFGALRRVFYSIDRTIDMCRARPDTEITRKEQSFRRIEKAKGSARVETRFLSGRPRL